MRIILWIGLLVTLTCGIQWIATQIEYTSNVDRYLALAGPCARGEATPEMRQEFHSLSIWLDKRSPLADIRDGKAKGTTLLCLNP